MTTIKRGPAPTDVIEIHHSEAPDDRLVIEARSNLSMTLDRLAAVFLALSALTLLVALGPTILGYWPIMVAAMVHIVIVGWCLRLAWRGNWVRERFLIDGREVVIEHFDARQRSSSQWPTSWLQVEVENRPMGERRVVVSCQGRRQVIGAFLPVTERLELARVLKQGLRPRSAWSSD